MSSVGMAENAIVTAIATISLVKMIVGRFTGLASRYTTEPSSISGPIAPVPAMTPMIGTIVASANPPRRSAATWSSAPLRPRTATESTINRAGSALRMRARRRPSRAR